jgi:pimeloyl-ACP methyl ester carboxylesterase
MLPITHNQLFGTETPNAKVDVSQLVLSGHSFGGITALMTASKLGSKCKAVCVMDPWFYAFWEEFKNGEVRVIDCPV